MRRKQLFAAACCRCLAVPPPCCALLQAWQLPGGACSRLLHAWCCGIVWKLNVGNVGSIARWDVPDRWPGLVEYLVQRIGARTDALLISGAVRCLSLFVNELGEEKVLQVALGEGLDSRASARHGFARYI